MKGILRDFESLGSARVLAATVAVAGVALLWPRVGGAVYGALSGPLGTKGGSLAADAIGAVGAQMLKGMLPGHWKVAADVTSGVLVYDGVQTLLPSQLPALTGGA